MAIQTSLRGRKIGLDPSDRLLVQPASAGIDMAAGLLAYSSVAASTAVSNTTTETVFDKYATLPANFLQPGSLIRIRWQGIATATNSTDTLAVKLYIHSAATLTAGTLLWTHAATDVADNNVFAGEYELAVRTIGSSGTVVGVGSGKSVPAAEGTATFKDDILASTAIDTTVAQYIGATATWSVASASNSCRLDFIRVIVH
jgi:hypothetical protein